MQILDTDLFVLKRGATDHFQVTGLQLKEYFNTRRLVQDITERDGFNYVNGESVYVIDASTEADVDAGGALYIWDSSLGAAGEFRKKAEDESFDVVVVPANLAYTASPTQGQLDGGGTAAVIPAVNATNAGLATPAMLAASHVAATAVPNRGITVSANQEIAFDIGTLPALP